MPEQKPTFKLAEVEGPMDLILHLIAKHKLNIYDIAISELVRQYLAYIEEMQRADLDVSSEFLEMAARLVHIKTVMLLPRHEEEAESSRAELTGQLLEYAACKQAAEFLRRKDQGQILFVRPPAVLEPDKTYRRSHQPGELLSAYNEALGRGRRRLPPPRAAFSGIVSRRVVPVESRIPFVLGRLYRDKRVDFGRLFDDAQERSELVATFLAVLQLIKDKRIVIDGAGSVELYRGSGQAG